MDRAPELAKELTVPRAVKTRPLKTETTDLETEYAVSPSTPLLSTEVQENAWVCGLNTNGQLGLGTNLSISQPQPVQSVGRWAALAFGEAHSAGLSHDGQLFTWGHNTRGQLGNGSMSPQVETPLLVEALADLSVKAVACGAEYTIAVTAKDVFSWGSNDRGQLGREDANCEVSPRPFPIKALHDTLVTQVVCGRQHSICVTAQSQVYSWGCNNHGQLGLGDRKDRSVPTVVDGLWALPVIQLAAGEYHSVALTCSGHMFIWGSNQFGQLGLVRDGESLSSLSSRRKKKHNNQSFLMALLEMGIPKAKAELALSETGNVGVEVATEWLFAVPERMELGVSEGGSPSSVSSVDASEDSFMPSPKRVPLKGVHHISAGAFHTLACTDDAVYSWGQGAYGQLGHGTTKDQMLPVRIKALLGKPIERVSCGQNHTLFLRKDGVVYGCGSCKAGQLGPTPVHRLCQDKLVLVPTKIRLPFQSGAHQQGAYTKTPIVHQVVAGAQTSALLTRDQTEIPDVYSINLLEKLQHAISKASTKLQNGDKLALSQALKNVSSGVEMVFGSAAAISSAFGYHDRVGLDVELLEKVQQSILKLFDQEESKGKTEGNNESMPNLSNALADLHKFSMVQSMFNSAGQLLEDLNTHLKMLHMPERAQVLLAAAQHPLLSEHHLAKALLPRLCSIILQAPKATRHLLVKWWSDYPAELLEERVVKPIQSYLTKELMATKKLTISVMNAIKVLAKVEEANQISRRLPPEAFYNQLISEKMDVQDHYTAWRQTQDQPVRHRGSDGPFSFCSYPFLLDPRAKSNLLHIEARFQMEQTVAHARMEAQLFGGGPRSRDDDPRVIASKSVQRPDEPEGSNGQRKRTSDSGGRKPTDRQGLRGLFFNILRNRFDSNGSSSSVDSPRSLSDTVQREGSMHLPRPRDCNMPSIHSDMCIIRVRRHKLVMDALDEIARQFKRDLFKPLRVHFIGEEGIDAGGVKKEFFQLLVSELLNSDYGMLVYQPESHTYWFNACSLEGEEQFMLLGLVLGLAIYNRVLLDFPLPLALYKKLLGQPVGLRELEDMQPILGRSLRKLLQYDDPTVSVEECFCLTFSVEMDYFGDLRTVPLRTNGEEIAVTEENRHAYVDLMVDYLLNKSVKWQFDAFTAGFKILCDGPAISLFNAQEVERLVCGNPNLDFDALERNAKYEGGFTAASQAVIWLWQLVKEFTLEEKKLFLKFFTGSDRSPIGGLGALKCVIQRDGPDGPKLPTSHTCFNTLLLPEYSSKSKMEHLLKLAVMNSEGFGLE